jgi:hypothetical protein
MKTFHNYLTYLTIFTNPLTWIWKDKINMCLFKKLNFHNLVEFHLIWMNFINLYSIPLNSIQLNFQCEHQPCWIQYIYIYIMFSSIHFNLRISIQLSCIQFNLHYANSFNIIFTKPTLFFFNSSSLVMQSPNFILHVEALKPMAVGQ